MSQQINLFNPAFVPRVDIASGKYAAAGIAIALILAITASVWARWHTAALTKEEASLVLQLNDARAITENLSQQLGSRKVDPALEKEQSEIDLAIKGRTQVANWLGSEGLVNTLGVSEYFRALARQTVSGVWLTRFDMGGNGKQLRIEGRSLHGDLLPRYLEMLGEERSLGGRAFSTVALEEAVTPGAKEHTPRVLSFQLDAADPSSVVPGSAK